MEDKEFNKGIAALKEIGLSEQKRRDMLARLSRYADSHPPVQASVASSWMVAVFAGSYRYAIAGLAIFLVAGGSLAYAAEGSLPGDLLYPVKVSISEPLRGAAAVTPSAKAKWEAKKVERRLREVEELASQGRLDDDSVTRAEERLDKHFEQYKKLETKADEKGAKKGQEKRGEKAEASDDSPMEKTIQEHKEILKSVKTPDESEQNKKIEKIERKLEEKSNRSQGKGGKK